jgi:hypothetical protein
MTETALLIERLLNSDGVHAFVLVCEAADKYLPMIDSITVPLANNQSVKVTSLSPEIAQKVEETRATLKREDRIVWALRHYKKALIYELLWMTQHEPQFFQKKAGAPPAPDQSGLQRQLQKLSDTDISPFQESDPDDPESLEPPYVGFATIDAINQSLGHYLELADTYGEREPDNIIHRLIFQRQTPGEIVAMFRRGEIDLIRKYMANWEAEVYNRKPFDLKDKEGPIETILQFPNGWRWFNLHRKCSTLHGEDTMGHCGNVAGPRESQTIYELAEPVTLGGKQVWKPHATFILDTANGLLGEMKGRKNQKPSPRLWKYIFELLLQRKEIKGLIGSGYAAENNFKLRDFTPHYIEFLRRERPEFWENSSADQLPEHEPPRVIRGRVGPPHPA